jgi:hypothetical protein
MVRGIAFVFSMKATIWSASEQGFSIFRAMHKHEYAQSRNASFRSIHTNVFILKVEIMSNCLLFYTLSPTMSSDEEAMPFGRCC